LFEIVEVGGYFFGFWMFLFSPKYRKIIIDDWTSSGWGGKVGILFGAISSIFCGVVIPLYIIKMIIEN
jgi:hypothetical protein